MKQLALLGLGLLTGLFGLLWAREEARVAAEELLAAELWTRESRQLSELLLELETAVENLDCLVRGEVDRRQLMEQIRAVQQTTGISFAAKLPELGQLRRNDGPVVKQVISDCQVECSVSGMVATLEALETSGPFWLRVGKMSANAPTGEQMIGQAERVVWTFDLEYLELREP